MSQPVWKLVIVAEEILHSKLVKLVKDAGATGYTVMPAGGEGSRNVRSTGDPVVSHKLANIKFEVLIGSRVLVDEIVRQIEQKFYTDYSIITYVSQVEALREHKF